MSETPEVSVIIPVQNEAGLIRATLDAVTQSTGVAVEVIVVDDGSTDSCCDFLRRGDPRFAGVRLITQDNQGIARARNRGASEAGAEALLFLDAHCFPQPGWLERLLMVLREGDGGIVAPCISSVTEPMFKGFGLVLVDSLFGYRWLSRQGDAPYTVPIAGGGCLLMSKELFEVLGRFDQMRGFGVEDVELCLRCWLTGWPVRVVPDAEVRHLFRPRMYSLTGWENYVYNAMRAAVLHFDGAERASIFDQLRTKPGYAAAADRLLTSDIWERYGFVRKMRKREVGWFFREFSIHW